MTWKARFYDSLTRKKTWQIPPSPPQTKPTPSGGFLAVGGKYTEPELLSDCESSSGRIWNLENLAEFSVICKVRIIVRCLYWRYFFSCGNAIHNFLI